MKKFFLLAVVCLMTLAASAQNFQVKSFDVKGNFRSDFGLGAGVTMGADVFDFAPSFNYYFTNKSNYWDIDADLHYNIEVANDVTIYPILGLAILHGGDDTNIGGNLGCGVAYDLSGQWAVKAELKYQLINHWDDLYLSVGLSYKF